MRGKESEARDAALKRAELDLARDIAEGSLERFGAGMTIDDALARLRGDAGSLFANDGVIWDVASFGDPDEAMTISKVLNSHGIRSGVFHHKLVFKHADIALILEDLGLVEKPSVEDGRASQGSEGAFAPVVSENLDTPQSAGSGVNAPYIDSDMGSARVTPAAPIRGKRLNSSHASRIPHVPADTSSVSRSELIAENEAAVQSIRCHAFAGSQAVFSRPVLSDADRSELLERVASLRDERDVPALSNPLRVPESLSHLLGFDAPAVPKSFAGRFVKICLQLLLIYAVCLAGEQIADMIPLGIPGNIVSMGLLLAFLISGVIRMESISLAADFLLDHMAVFFIPAAVAIMGSFDLIAPNLLKLLFVCLVTTVLVFFTTSFTVSTVMNLMARRSVATGDSVSASSDPTAPSSDNAAAKEF